MLRNHMENSKINMRKSWYDIFAISMILKNTAIIIKNKMMAFYVAKGKGIGEYCLLWVKTTFILHVSQTPLCLLSIWSYSWSYEGQKLLLISIRTWTRVCFSFWKAANMIPPWRGLWALYRFSKPHILHSDFTQKPLS